MTVYYQVKGVIEKLPIADEDPYGIAVLNAVQYNTDVTGNIIIAALNAPWARLENYYKRGKNTYSRGLPELSLASGLIIPDLMAKKHVLSRFSISDCEIVNATFIKGSDVNLDELSKQHAMLYASGKASMSTVHGYSVYGEDFPPESNEYHPRDNLPQPEFLIGSNTTAEVSAAGSSGETFTEILFSQERSSSDVGFACRTHFFTRHYSVNNGSVTEVITNDRVETTSQVIRIPAPDDDIARILFKDPNYPKETFITFGNLSTGEWKLWLVKPTVDILGTAYPIVPIRVRNTWMQDYYVQAGIDDITDQFETLGIGKIDVFKEQLDNNSGIGDLSEMHFALGVNANGNTPESNKYFFRFLTHLNLVSTGYEIHQDNVTYNVLRIKEDDANIALLFRKFYRVTYQIIDYATTDIPIIYVVNYSLEAGFTEEFTDASWTHSYVCNTNANDESCVWVPVSEQDSTIPEELRMLSKDSHIITTVKAIRADTLATVEKFVIHGLASSTTIEIEGKIMHSSTYSSADNQLKFTQYNDWVSSGDNVDNNGDPVEYTGDIGEPLFVPLIHEITVMYLQGERDDLLKESGQLLVQGKKIINVPWWREALGDLLMIIQGVAIFLSILSMGATLSIASSAQAMGQLMYQMGMDYLKKAITKIIIVELIKLTGDDNLLAFADVISGAVLGDIDFTDFSIGNLYDISMKLTQAVYTYKLSSEYADLDNLSKDADFITEEPDTVQKVTEEKDVILVETTDEFLNRIYDTNYDLSASKDYSDISLEPDSTLWKDE